MASITKHSFLFVLVGLSCALIASAEARIALSVERPPASLSEALRAGGVSAEARGLPAVAPGAKAGALSVPFIQNQGQVADPHVLYYARTFGGTVYVTADGQLVYVLPKSVERGALSVECGAQSAVIREQLVDADPTALPSGAERSGAIINSFIGNNPRRWQANIPSFTAVQFGDIYEGISLEVRATGDNVEKIFTVAPGADPARIALCLAGAEGVSITPEGELEARTALGPVRFTVPVAYQRSATGERQDVSVAYVLEGDQVGFCVGVFDAARPLMIDPLLASTFIGGANGNNVIRVMALDSQTNVLVAGYTASTDFPITNSPYQGSSGGGLSDAFIAKFDSYLTNLLAATYLGGAGEDAIMAMGINSNNGAVYVAGYTASTDFPIKNAAYATYRGGAYDAFVSELNSNLTELTASTYLGGTNVDMAYAVALNAAADVYVAGLTSSTNFPTNNTYGATFQNTLKGTNDAFVTKFDTALSATRASTFVGGTSNDQAFSMAIDTNDFIYLAGITASANFPSTNGFKKTLSGASDAFVTKLSGALTNVVASTYLGGTSNEAANGVAVAPFTNIVCVVGYTESGNYHRYPTNTIAPGYTNQFMGGRDAFLTRLDLALTNIRASTYLGGTGDDEATAVLTSDTSNTPLRIYVAGWTTSTNFPVTTNAYDTTANGGRDAFVSYFNTTNTLQASTYLGGATNDRAYAMALQADHFSLLVAGATASTNFPATLRAYNNDRTGRTNDYGFVTKLGSGLAYGSLKWQVPLTTYGDGYALFISPSLGWDGTIYIGGGSNLYAYDANGIQRWRFRANGRLHDDGGGYWGLGSTPAVARDGTIYFGTQNGYLHAVSKDGVGLWTNLFSGHTIYSSPAIGNDGTIYFGSTVSPFPLYAVSSNGTIRKWTNNVASSIIGSPAIDTNGRIYVASSSPTPRLYMIDTNGTTLTNWSMSDAIASSPMIGSNGWVYIGSGTKLFGFNAASSASQTWTAAGTIYSSPAMDSNGVIYVGGGNNLYAFNTNGTTNYTWNTEGAVKSSPAIAEDGTIYVGSADTNLYAFNPNGKTNWVFQTDYELNFQSPLIRRDGTVYFADVRYLYAICGQAQISRSSWPAYKHDVLRTGNAAHNVAQILKPTGLTASQGAYTNRVLVSWIGDANAEYYELFRGTNDVDTLSLYQTLLTTNCVDTNVAPGMIYYYRVRVATPVIMSDFSAGTNGGVPPLPPTGVVGTKGNPTNEIVITWNVSSNATMYYLYHSLTNATNTAALLTTTNITGFTNAAIDRGLTYYYWVKAGNGAAGISAFSIGNYGGTPPLQPANITASTNSYLAVNVAWSASTGATMYAVYRNTSNSIPGSSIVTNISVTNYGDAATIPLLDYYYWVRGTNEFGRGEFSTSAVGCRLMGPPLAISASDGTFTNKVLVSWYDPYSVATAYRIYRNTSNSVAESDFLAEVAYDDPTATNYYDLNITRGAGYYYWMKAKSAAGTSVMSTAYDIGGTAPRAPLNVNASDGVDYNPVTVTWNAADYATAYEVYRQDSYVLPSTPLGIAYGTEYLDAQARNGQLYYYWVKSTNQFGRSELSGFDTGWRTLAPPFAIAASDGTSEDHLYVTWSVSDNASGYELWRGTNSDRAAARVLVNTVATNNYDDTDSVQGVLYYYWVKAKTTQFVSDFSPYDSGYRALRQVDIGVSDLVFLPTRMAVVGSPEAVSFRVANYGVQNMAAPNAWVACNFYISSNSVFGDFDDKWMGGTNLSIPLTVGNSTVVVLPKAARDVVVVPTVVPGLYNIFVNIQHATPTKWLDPNLANNTISRNGGVIRIGATQPAGLLLVNDYNGDGYTDLAMYQESMGTWQVWFFGAQGFTAPGYGGPGFKAVPRDYDSDGKTDLAVYQEATGTWEIWFSAYNYAMAQIGDWGGHGFEPVPSDYDGDGLADPAVYQASTGTWRVWLSGAGYAMVSAQGVGGASFQPVPGDYDGDGKADPAVYQEATGTWRIWRSIWNYAPVAAGGLGGTGYRPVAADYDCDGIMDPAVFKVNTGSWKIWLSASGYAEVSAHGLGGAGMVAVPGDFDGDSLTDPALYWDAFGMWRLWLSGSGYQQTDILAWPGAEGFRPVWP